MQRTFPEFSRRGIVLSCIFGLAAFLASTNLSVAELIKPGKTLYTEVFVRAADSTQRDERVAGTVISYDDRVVTLKSVKGERELKWVDLTASSAFGLRSRMTDKTNANGWLELGRFAWSIGAESQARTSLANATRMDPALKSAADAITAVPAGGAGSAGSASQGATASAASRPAAQGELIHGKGTVPTTASVIRSRVGVLRPKDNSPKKPTEKYVKSTPEQDAAAIAKAKQTALAVEKQFDVTFVTIETSHFILFTDWDPREHDFLKENLEEAYTAVSSQFEIPSKENIFIGKLPVYMFARFHDFGKFTDSIGFLGEPTPRSLQGYYEGDGGGTGRLVMYKPAADDLEQARLQWAHSLVHEFTHAFVARYRTNARVPRWLNEGVAEVIAAKNFPSQDTYPFARWMAAEHKTADDLFDDEKMPHGEWYPVMQTLVEFLVAQNRGAFLKMFDAIKSGTDGEAALKQFYKVDYAEFYDAWRQAVLHAGGGGGGGGDTGG